MLIAVLTNKCYLLYFSAHFRFLQCERSVMPNSHCRTRTARPDATEVLSSRVGRCELDIRLYSAATGRDTRIVCERRENSRERHAYLLLKLFFLNLPLFVNLNDTDSLAYKRSLGACYALDIVSYCSCSLAVLDPRVGHTMDVLSPFIPVLCHSD